MADSQLWFVKEPSGSVYITTFVVKYAVRTDTGPILKQGAGSVMTYQLSWKPKEEANRYQFELTPLIAGNIGGGEILFTDPPMVLTTDEEGTIMSIDNLESVMDEAISKSIEAKVLAGEISESEDADELKQLIDGIRNQLSELVRRGLNVWWGALTQKAVEDDETTVKTDGDNCTVQRHVQPGRETVLEHVRGLWAEMLGAIVATDPEEDNPEKAIAEFEQQIVYENATKFKDSVTQLNSATGYPSVIETHSNCTLSVSCFGVPGKAICEVLSRRIVSPASMGTGLKKDDEGNFVLDDDMEEQRQILIKKAEPAFSSAAQNMVKLPRHVEIAIRAAFERVDKDHSGRLDAEELAVVMKDISGTDADPEEIRKMLKEIDEDGDQQVDPDEFRSFFIRLGTGALKNTRWSALLDGVAASAQIRAGTIYIYRKSVFSKGFKVMEAELDIPGGVLRAWKSSTAREAGKQPDFVAWLKNYVSATARNPDEDSDGLPPMKKTDPRYVVQVIGHEQGKTDLFLTTSSAAEQTDWRMALQRAINVSKPDDEYEGGADLHERMLSSMMNGLVDIAEVEMDV